MIAISACLMGIPCRYNGETVSCPDLVKQCAGYPVILFCPEVLGGLLTPRSPAEICDGTGVEVLKGQAQIRNAEGNDVTQFYLVGAQRAAALLKECNVQLAVLKEKSPSCGLHYIYDGSFTGQLVKGSGVCAQLLKNRGIQLCNEAEMDVVSQYFLEKTNDCQR